MKIINKITGHDVTDEAELMELAGMERYCKFEDIGIQGDGTPVVFNKCGDFGYLNTEVYECVDVLINNGE